jgi:hypothetical protein
MVVLWYIGFSKNHTPISANNKEYSKSDKVYMLIRGSISAGRVLRHTCAQVAQKCKDLLVLVAGLAFGENGAAGNVESHFPPGPVPSAASAAYD